MSGFGGKVNDIANRMTDHGKKRPLFSLRTFFLTGLVVAAPIAITVYVTWTFVSFMDRTVIPLIPDRYNPETYLPYTIPGLGVVIAFFAISLLGMLTANFLGRTLLGMGERVVETMPVVRTIYATLKQIMETVVANSEQSFQQVGLIEYPRKGLWAIAFVTTVTKGEIQSITDDEVVSVFLPTTPNPTSGFLLFVPKKDIKILDMTVEEGAKAVISAGLVVPDPNEVKVPGRNGRNGRNGKNGEGHRKAIEPAAAGLPQVELPHEVPTIAVHAGEGADRQDERQDRGAA